MVKNIILYIFIYVLCISCSDITGSTDYVCDYCELELSIDELGMDSNNYYQLYFNQNYYQTFTKVTAYVGYEDEYVGWTSNKYFVTEIHGYEEYVNVVNGSSYTTEEGYAYTMLGIYEENVGDTIIVYCGYYDEYGYQHLDSLGVIVYE